MSVSNSTSSLTDYFSLRVFAVPSLMEWMADAIYAHRKLLLIVILLTYIAGFNGQWRLEPDAALYLTLGRNLAEGRGYTYLWQPHRLAYPGLPWVLAGIFKVFGTQHFWPPDLVMLLISFAALALVYRLFLLHCGPRMATVITVGVAVTKTFYRYAFEIRSDMPFLLGVLAFLCGYEAIFTKCIGSSDQKIHEPTIFDWTLLIGGLALAMVMRPTIWLVLLALVLTVAVAVIRGRVRWQAVVITIAVIATGAIAFHALDPRRPGAAATDDYEAYAIHAVTTGWKTTLSNIVHINLPELLYKATPDSIMQVRFGHVNVVLSLVFIAIGIALVRQRVLWGMLVAMIVLMNLGILALDRYYLPVIPLLTYAWWISLQSLERWINRRSPKPIGALVVLILLGIGLCSNLDKIGGIILEQQWRPFLAKYDRGEYQTLPALAQQINQHVDDRSLVLAQHAYGRIITFLSDRNIADLRDYKTGISLKGRQIYVIEPSDSETAQLLEQNGLTPGAEVARSPGENENSPWIVKAVVPK